MTLTVKLLLVAALVLGIIVPFGYFLKGERSKKRYKRALGANVVFYFAVLNLYKHNMPLLNLRLYFDICHLQIKIYII